MVTGDATPVVGCLGKILKPGGGLGDEHCLRGVPPAAGDIFGLANNDWPGLGPRDKGTKKWFTSKISGKDGFRNKLMQAEVEAGFPSGVLKIIPLLLGHEQRPGGNQTEGFPSQCLKHFWGRAKINIPVSSLLAMAGGAATATPKMFGAGPKNNILVCSGGGQGDPKKGGKFTWGVFQAIPLNLCCR